MLAKSLKTNRRSPRVIIFLHPGLGRRGSVFVMSMITADWGFQKHAFYFFFSSRLVLVSLLLHSFSNKTNLFGYFSKEPRDHYHPSYDFWQSPSFIIIIFCKQIMANQDDTSSTDTLSWWMLGHALIVLPWLFHSLSWIILDECLSFCPFFDWKLWAACP